MNKASRTASQSFPSFQVPAPPHDAPSGHARSYLADLQHNGLAEVNDDGRVSLDFRANLTNLTEDLAVAVAATFTPPIQHQVLQSGDRTSPPLNIVLQVVGSQGDVQPFVALGLALQSHGHHVRIATHPQFQQFVKSYGLEFFSIGGDPAELMAYMVKNPGLFPKFVSVQKGEVQKRRRAMRDMMNACWRSCFESPDDFSDIHGHHGDPKPFVADAIIANPPSFAHVHCAEKLGIPCHMVFTMPWSPTKELPHPLANIAASQKDANYANLLSFFLIDALIWQGLGDIVNSFRRNVLDLEPIEPTQAPGLTSRLRIPQTYCWSPSLVPKPSDWSMLAAVTGYFHLPTPVNYSPQPALSKFLESGSPPVYIGFGSIVVDDPAAMTKIVLDAIRIAGVRAIVSKGWGQLGDGNASSIVAKSIDLESSILFISSCPHDWLFSHVSCVVHHGGAGTTAAGLAAGKPTIVVPFFGDQPFWGNMIHRYGVGPKPIPAKELTAEKLAAAIVYATTDTTIRTRAVEIRQQISREDGLRNAVDHFHRCLPESIFVNPDVDVDCHLHVWRYTKKKGSRNIDVGLSTMAATVLKKEKLVDWSDLKLHRHVKWDSVHCGPREPFSGAVLAVGDLFYDSFKGMGEILYEFLRPPYASSVKVWEANRTDAWQHAQVVPAMTVSRKPDSSVDTRTYPDVGISESSKVFNTRRYIPGRHVLTGTLRIGKAAVRAPGAFTVAMARGAHNFPTLWGDRTVRPQQKITGIGSGLKEGVKELTFGVSDGISGLVVQPVLGFREGGPLGFVKGVGKGVVGLPVKFYAAASGIVGYPLKGVDVSITNAFKRSDSGLKAVRHARMLQGEFEYMDASVEQRQSVVDRWMGLVVDDEQ